MDSVCFKGLHILFKDNQEHFFDFTINIVPIIS